MGLRACGSRSNNRNNRRRRVASSSGNATPPTVFNLFAVRYAPGVSPAAAYASLRSEFGSVVLRRLPSEDVLNIQSVGRLPLILAGLVALLGVTTIGNSLVTSVRRRRRDLAILKAIGFVPRQVAGVVSWQATTFSVVALIVGIPLGVIAGRWTWHLVASSIGSSSPAQVPDLLVALDSSGDPFGVQSDCGGSWVVRRPGAAGHPDAERLTRQGGRSPEPGPRVRLHHFLHLFLRGTRHRRSRPGAPQRVAGGVGGSGRGDDDPRRRPAAHGLARSLTWPRPIERVIRAMSAPPPALTAAALMMKGETRFPHPRRPRHSYHHVYNHLTISLSGCPMIWGGMTRQGGLTAVSLGGLPSQPRPNIWIEYGAYSMITAELSRLPWIGRGDVRGRQSY